MKILITAGPTWEPIDAVRYLGNRSSGRMGLAITQAALVAGHQVTLLAGPGVPVETVTDAHATVHRFESASQLLELMQTHFPNADLLFMAAAVADYTPMHEVKGKLPRQNDGTLSITLKPTPDLVATIAKTKQPHQRVIAFALEQPDVLVKRATEKLLKKKVDAIIANPLKTMGADDIEPTWLQPDGQKLSPGVMTKTKCAAWLLQQAQGLFE